MKLRLYLIIIILVPFLMGIAMILATKNQYQKLDDAEQQLMNSELLYKDITRLTFDIKQYFLSTDILLSTGDTYLVAGTQKKANVLSTALDTLIKEEKEESITTKLNALKLSFTLFLDRFEKISREILINPQIIHEIQLDEIDTLSAQAALNTEETIDTVKAYAAHSKNKVKEIKQTLKKLLIALQILFLSTCIITWRWAYRHISEPIQQLNHITKNSQDKLIKGVSNGPKEIIDLSNSFCGLANNLFFQANHDSLTGLYNRMAFNRMLQSIFSEGKSSDDVHTICFIDLDHFKAINDSCGHSAGDELLKQLANIMEENIRQGDIVARLGGDEFTILFKDCTSTKARYLTEKVRKGIKEYEFYWDEKKFHVSSSFGLCEFRPAKSDFNSVINLADQACMHAKKTGRNCTIDVLESTLPHKNTSESITLNDIHNAIENNLFLLYKQDIRPSNAEGGLSGKRFELLLRMKDQDDTENHLSPSVFMPVVERYGLFPDVDRWVIKSAIEWLKQHPDNYNDTNLCSINLSGHSVCSSEMLSFLDTELSKAPNLGEKLCFEITETEAINDFEYAKELIEKIKSFGCRVALDDFGSGLSSFSYLKNLDIDYVKIDGSFVKDMLKNASDKATVKAILDVANAFNKQTIAEFVETEDVARALVEMGVDFMQGYHFDMPKPLV